MTAYQIKPRPSSLAKAERSEKYLTWLRTQPCAHCGRWKRNGQKSEAAHTGHSGKGLGIKATDWDAIPLCDRCHRTANDSYHAFGDESKWASFHNLDLAVIRGRLLGQYAIYAGLADLPGDAETFSRRI